MFDAAISLFTERGYRAVTLGDIDRALNAVGERCVVGDQDVGGERQSGQPHQHFGDPVVGLLNLTHRDGHAEPAPLVPLYLRRPDAKTLAERILRQFCAGLQRLQRLADAPDLAALDASGEERPA